MATGESSVPPPAPAAGGPGKKKTVVLVIVAIIVIAALGTVVVLLTLPPPPPVEASAPQNLQATSGNAQVTLTWQAPASNGGSAITGYKVYRGTTAGSESLLTSLGNVLRYTDSGLTNGQTYYYQVSAVNGVGEGPKSNEASATPAGPAPVLDRVEVSASKTQLDEREALSVSATAFDTAGADRTGDVALTWSAAPSGQVVIEPSASQSQKSVIAVKAGTATVTATATLDTVSKSGSLSLSIADLRFEVTSSSTTPLVGSSVTLTVRALRADSTVATTYQGEVNFTSNRLATLPPNTAFASTDQGRKDFAGVRFNEAGTAQVTVRDTIADITGVLTLDVQRPPTAPTASFTVARIRMTVDVDASASRDPDNDIATYAWNWGDGQTDGPSASPTATHTYTNPGFYTIILTVTDATSGTDVTARKATVAQSTLDTEIFDLYKVPFGEYWDWRGAFYGDIPVGATCFTFEGIPGGAGSPNPAGTGACDIPPTGYSGETWAAYPYMDWYPWYFDSKSTFVYAPYRMRMVGVDQPGSTLDQPVILPVFNPAEAAGSTLGVVWDLRYITSPEAPSVDLVCGSSIESSYDGFVLESRTVVTMDLQESKRVFGVVATDAAEAATWWDTNADPDCLIRTTFERSWESWMAGQGGRSALRSGTGPYDIATAFEWYYQPFATNFESATVDPTTGLTTVTILHWSWGTEALLGRWFYWGTTKFFDAGPDGDVGTADDVRNAETYPHPKAGWWPWEFVWFEDLHLDTTIGPSLQSFTLETVVQYHFAAAANAGSDGIFNTTTTPSTDDVAIWQWQPVLADYIYGGTVPLNTQHEISELDPYTGPDGRPNSADDLRYLHNSPGSFYYGKQFMYEYTPAEWDLNAGDTVVVRTPTGAVKFIDPDSPTTASAADLILFDSNLGFSKSTPVLPAARSDVIDSNGDGIQDTIALFGPIDWGAPDFRLVSYPVLEFSPQSAGSLSPSAKSAGSSIAELRTDLYEHTVDRESQRPGRGWVRARASANPAPALAPAQYVPHPGDFTPAAYAQEIVRAVRSGPRRTE